MDTAIYIGEDYTNPSFSFDQESIISVSVNSSVDLIQNEMQTDTAEITVFYDDENGELRNLSWETPVWIYSEDSGITKFYSTAVKRISAKQFQISAISYVGFLDDEKFYGGVYDGIRFPKLIEQIVRTDGLNTLLPVTSLNISKLVSNTTIGGILFFYINQHLDEPMTEWEIEYSQKVRDVRNRRYVKLKFNGFVNDSYSSQYGMFYSCIWGQVLSGLAGNNGIMGTFIKDSGSGLYPLSTELTYYYRTSTFSLGTPNVGDIIEIDCRPMQGKVIINGVEHSVEVLPAETHSYFVVGGGIYSVPGSGYYINHHCDIEFLENKVYYYNDDSLLFDQYPLVNTRDNSVIVRIGKDSPYQKEIPCGNADTSVPSGDIAPGTFDSNYRKNFVDSITYSPSVANYRIYGWISICTKREAIHQILLSSGFTLKKDSSGNWLFSNTQNTISESIPTQRIFDNGTVEYSNTVGEIILKEHKFIDGESIGQTVESIYSTEDTSPTMYIAEFSKKPSRPHSKDLFAYSENAALIPGNVVDIEGYPYRHDEKVYSVKSENSGGSTISLENVTTITPENSGMMLDRLEKYYLKTHRCKFDIVKQGEKCGIKYSFINPFGEVDNGFLVSSNEALSSFSRSKCEFLCGYEPESSDDEYSNYVILTGNGTWSVPQSVFESGTPKIRVVVIGGGNGGYNGLAGQTGTSAPRDTFTTAASGGEAGEPGTGGKIYDVVINNPSASYSYSAGVGGSGAGVNTSSTTHNSGGIGGDSVLTDGTNTYSSASGEPKESGHINFLTGDRYASQFRVPGWKEIIKNTSFTKLQNRYGYGGWGGYIEYNTRASNIETKGGNSFRTSANHAYNNQYSDYNPEYSGSIGGDMGDCYPSNIGYDTQYDMGGGLGGGAGINSPGEKGYNATSSKAGNGGKGGDCVWIPPDALAYNPTYYGYGGHGGGGGGGGGSSGYTRNGTPGVGGSGGKGGAGGKGGDGCILIYY